MNYCRARRSEGFIYLRLTLGSRLNLNSVNTGTVYETSVIYVPLVNMSNKDEGQR